MAYPFQGQINTILKRAMFSLKVQIFFLGWSILLMRTGLFITNINYSCEHWYHGLEKVKRYNVTKYALILNPILLKPFHMVEKRNEIIYLCYFKNISPPCSSLLLMSPRPVPPSSSCHSNL